MSKQSRINSRQNRSSSKNGGGRESTTIVVIGFVVLIVVAFVTVLIVQNSNDKESNPDATTSTTGPVSAELMATIKNIPAATFASVGKGSADASPEKVTGDPLTLNGKPQVLYIGAEFCPYCAAERWEMVVALSRFGEFSNLKTSSSSSSDGFPDSPTFTFHESTYSSQYLEFVAVEAQDRVRKTLEKPTAEQQALWDKYNSNSYPFVTLGNRFVIKQPSFTPALLAEKSHQAIASSLADPSRSLSKAIVGGANQFTAAICALTNNQPGDVCTPAIQALAAGF